MNQKEGRNIAFQAVLRRLRFSSAIQFLFLAESSATPFDPAIGRNIMYYPIVAVVLIATAGMKLERVDSAAGRITADYVQT